MSATDNAARAVQQALSHPYVKRVMEDAELRDNARAAYTSAREAYDQLSRSKSPIDALLDEKKIHRSLGTAFAAFLGVRAGLMGRQKKKRRWGRVLLVAVVGGVVAIALSEGLRNKLLDLMFGAEEEFDYVPTTAPPAPPAPAPAPAAAAESVAEPAAEQESAAEASGNGDGAA
ncbi:MAG TPA: hypothetical protein VMT10_01595 [Solirubrobacteraceae bacterium]|nr:hypothetical protein [Solirubrobacteraceae bacterium]